MERVESLAEIVRREVMDYHGPALKATTYYFEDKENHRYTVVIVQDYPRKNSARVVVLAQVVGDTVIVEEDITDRPLYEALMRNGISREKIVLTYAGEQAPVA